MVGAAVGRRASLSGRGRVRTEALRGGGCYLAPKTAGCRRRVAWLEGTDRGEAAGVFFGGGTARTEVPAGQCLLSRSEDGRLPVSCCLVGGDGPRRGGEPLFRGGAGFGRVTHRLRYSPPLFASAIRLRCSLLSPAACHHSPPAITRRPLPPPPLLVTPVAVCLPAACHYPPPATSAADCVLTACVSTVCRFSPLVITTCRPPLPPAACLLPPSPACHHPLLPAPPPLPPAACLLPPSPACHHPLLPALPPLPPAATVACHPRYSPQSATTRCLPFPPPCAGRADRWAAAAPRVVGRGAMRRRREVLRNNLENRKILPIFVSVKYRGSGLSRPGFLFFIGLSFLWQKRLSI